MAQTPLGRYVGIWIDRSRAVIATPHRPEVITLASNVQPHTRFVGSGGYPGSDSAQSRGSEKRFEARHEQALAGFYDDVVAHLGQPEKILVFGPGETKQHLKEFLEDMPGAPKDIVVETADAMTDAQVAAHVARHFGVRPPRLMSRR